MVSAFDCIVNEQPTCFVVRDHNEQQLAYVYFEDEPGRRSETKLLSKDEARRIAETLLNYLSCCAGIVPVQPMSDESEISEAGRKARFERWEQLGVDVIRTDLEATGGLRFVGGPPSVRKLAWEWVRMKEAGSKGKPASSPTKGPAKAELLTLNPGIWGMSIDQLVA
jgi:hypothetical protein